MASRSLSLTDVITLAAAIAGIGVSVAGAYTGVRRLYRRTIGSRRDLAKRLNQVAAGVTSDYINARFGVPAFARDFTWSNSALFTSRAQGMTSASIAKAAEQIASKLSPVSDLWK